MPYKDPKDPRQLQARRNHYYNNREVYIERAKAKKEELKQLVRELKDKPCADCGVKYPYYVMQFDHLGDKEYGVARLVNLGNRSKIIAEVAKCEVVCANCHMERTHRRLNGDMV